MRGIRFVKRGRGFTMGDKCSQNWSQNGEGWMCHLEKGSSKTDYKRKVLCDYENSFVSCGGNHAYTLSEE